MRLFVGIPLGDETAGELAALVSRLGASGDGLRWTKPESWHITLQFLGNATPEQMQCLRARLAEVHSAPAPVALGEMGSFERTGVFFADVAVTPGLLVLQERVVAATARCGFVAEARPFHPHITLARKAGNRKTGTEGTREQGDKPAGSKVARGQGAQVPRTGLLSLRDFIAKVGACRFSRFTAHEFLLYQSHLGPQGSRYEVRARFPLNER